MATLEKDIVENSGLMKELDADSISMMLDIVQKDLYTYPIESSVRENFSNAFDSIQEKNEAISILTGKALVEDYYTVDNRIETRSSKFDPDYYSLKYLASDKNTVNIIYRKAFDEGKDIVFFEDTGVGLGGKRLQGFFKPGFSTKRLSKKLLGKYGLGSKSALSTNIEFYVVESWYNGHYTKVMIYDDYYKCVIPESQSVRQDEIKGFREVDGEIVEATDYIRWAETSRHNGVTLSFHVKSHNTDKFIDAVKKQLLYFGDYLNFEVIEANGTSYHPSFKAQILLETDMFIVSNNKFYSVPHILINNVNYGIIDFPELNMDKKHGSVAVKASMANVDVNANRESVRWTPRTRTYVQSVVEFASKEAGNILKEELESIENPLERVLEASRYSPKYDDAKSELIAQLKHFGGDVKIEITINPTDYIDFDTTIKEVRFSDIANVISKFKIVNVNVRGNQIDVYEADRLHSIDFKNLFFRKYEDKIESNKISEVLYISKKVMLKPAFQIISFGNNIPEPQLYKEFAKDYDGSKLLKDKSAEETLKYIATQYRLYKKHYEINTVAYWTFIGILKKFCITDSLDEIAIKEHNKTIGLAMDASLTTKHGMETLGELSSYNVSIKSDNEIKKLELAELKKEKKIIPYRVLTSNHLRNEEPYTFRLYDIDIDTLAAYKAPIVYASTEDRDLLILMGSLFNLFKNNNDIIKFKEGYPTINIENEKYILFIQVAKENIKFFKQAVNAINVKEMIKQEHSIIDGKLKMRFGDTVVSLMTAIHLHKLIEENSFNRLLTNKKFLEYVKDYVKTVPNVLKAYYILNNFSYISGENEGIIQYFSKAVTESTMREFLESMMMLSEIQDTPKEYLTSVESQKLVVKFDQIDIYVYDMNFIKDLRKEMTDNQDYLEKHYIMYLCNTHQYSNSPATKYVKSKIEDSLPFKEINDVQSEVEEEEEEEN